VPVRVLNATTDSASHAKPYCPKDYRLLSFQLACGSTPNHIRALTQPSCGLFANRAPTRFYSNRQLIKIMRKKIVRKAIELFKELADKFPEKCVDIFSLFFPIFVLLVWPVLFVWCAHVVRFRLSFVGLARDPR
jgi:hypothetical protein